MTYYYIVDSYGQLKNDPIAQRLTWDAMGTTEQDFLRGSNHGAEMLIGIRFGNPQLKEEFESQAYVHPLPDPLDNEPVSDEHFAKLERFHGHRKDSANGKWVHKDTGVVLAQVPHTRKLMNEHVAKHDRTFRFFIFD